MLLEVGGRREKCRSKASYPLVSALRISFISRLRWRSRPVGLASEFWYEVQVEISRRWCLGMHQQTATADPIRQLEQSGEHVLHKGRSQTVPFLASIHSEGRPARRPVGDTFRPPLRTREVAASVVTCAMDHRVVGPPRRSSDSLTTNALVVPIATDWRAYRRNRNRSAPRNEHSKPSGRCSGPRGTGASYRRFNRRKERVAPSAAPVPAGPGPAGG